MTMTTTQVHLPDRDVTLHVRVREGRDPSKDPAVLLHGWPISSATWEAVVAQMPDERSYICPDLRGLGASERKGDVASFTKHALTQDIAALLDRLGVGRYAAVGNDWGGVVAQELAFASPERVSRLVIMNIMALANAAGNLKGTQAQMRAPVDPRWYMTFQAIPDLAEAMIPGNEEAWIRYFMSHTADGNRVDEDVTREYVQAYATPGTARCGANYYRALSSDLRRWFGLAGRKLPMPTLLLYGAKDPFIVPDFYEGVEACFDDLTRTDIEAGHFVQEERPAEVAAALTRFLGGPA